MTTKPLWPFFFEVNLIQRRAMRERTVFVTLQRDGGSDWVDHTGRFTRRGGFGGISIMPGQPAIHSRGARELSPEEVEAEKREFTVSAMIPDSDFRPVRTLIERIGRPWLAGWNAEDSQQLHGLLEGVYWKHVNRFMHEPFDATDG